MNEMNENNPRPTITLQLNRAAMEALIGNDPELRVKLTHAVCNAFAERHILKCVENNKEVTKFLSALNETAKVELTKKIGTLHESWSNPRVTLSPEMGTRVERAVKTTAEAEMTRLANLAVEGMTDKLQAMVDAKVNSLSMEMIREKVARKLREIAT